METDINTGLPIYKPEGIPDEVVETINHIYIKYPFLLRSKEFQDWIDWFRDEK